MSDKVALGVGLEGGGVDGRIADEGGVASGEMQCQGVEVTGPHRHRQGDRESYGEEREKRGKQMLGIKTVDQYSKIVDQYSKTMEQYLKAVDQYSKTAYFKAGDQYSKTVDQYFRAVDQYSKAVDQYSKAVDQYSKTVDQYSKTVDQYLKAEDQYSKAVNQYLKTVDQYSGSSTGNCTQRPKLIGLQVQLVSEQDKTSEEA